MYKLIALVYVLVVVTITIRAFDVPVVFTNQQGERCACLVDEDMPSLSQCERVKEKYEEIHVSSCEF